MFGQRYAEALSEMRSVSWRELYEAHVRENFGAAESMVLIHPYWYGRDGGSSAETCPVRGKRSFDASSPSAGVACRSDTLWGYECPFASARLSPDHRFPFSLGGPTVGSNLIWLCSTHNRAKAADWHLEELVPGELQWFADVLKRVERHVLESLRD